MLSWNVKYVIIDDNSFGVHLTVIRLTYKNGFKVDHVVGTKNFNRDVITVGKSASFLTKPFHILKFSKAK